jgi:6-phospho-beta-glucosidase
VKVTVIGGGSTYTPELLNGFLVRATSFALDELWLMDSDPERLAVVGGFAQRMAAAHGAPFQIVLSDDRRAAIRGASYVITQLRVGGMAARRADEYLGHRHGLIGQETTGVGGMAKALRTIPVMLAIAGDIRELAPGALLVNFTNPAGLVTEALARYAPDVAAVGVCNIPIGVKRTILGLLERAFGTPIAPERAELLTLGLNHLSWHYGFVLDGEDIWSQVLALYREQLALDANAGWEADTVAALQMIPNYYLSYFYDTTHKLEEQVSWPPSRAEQVMRIEGELLRQYADPERIEPPPGLMQRGGAYYSTVATQLLNAHANNLNETHVVNRPHAGAVSGWPADWVLELPCRIGASGIHPRAAEPLPPVSFGLLVHVKAYELLTVEAAVHGDRRAAYQALLTHPLGPGASRAHAVLTDLLETHRAHLPRFFE